jgi:hypothetical protein
LSAMALHAVYCATIHVIPEVFFYIYRIAKQLYKARHRRGLI